MHTILKLNYKQLQQMFFREEDAIEPCLHTLIINTCGFYLDLLMLLNLIWTLQPLVAHIRMDSPSPPLPILCVASNNWSEMSCFL